MIENINKSQISDIAKEFSSDKPAKARVASDSKADACLQVSHEALIEKALQSPAEDASAVQRARQMILSGEIDKPENIRAAAENIVKFGI
jgi:hypothetical protein